MNAYGHNQTINTGSNDNGFPEPDIVSDISFTPDAAIIWVCDLNPKSVERIRTVGRVVGISSDPADILNPPANDAVAIVVPASRPFHF
jgi:hypothetical protein